MKFSLFFKLCIVLGLIIICLAVYLMPSSPIPAEAAKGVAAEGVAAEGVAAEGVAAEGAAAEGIAATKPVLTLSDSLPPLANSEHPDLPSPSAPAVRPGIESARTASAPPIQHKGLAARRVSSQTPASTPADFGNATALADLAANAPLPVPLPAAIVSGEVPAALPLALVSPDPDKELNQLQQMGRDSLRKGFIDAVGGPNQDTKDPEYLRRWLAATNESDERFKTMFGWKEYAQQQARAVQEAGGVKAYFEQLAAAQQQQQK